MQLMSQYVDRDMDLERLRTLGSRLALPEGWSYAAVKLITDFVFVSSIASVLNDDFENACTKIHRLHCEQCAAAFAKHEAKDPKQNYGDGSAKVETDDRPVVEGGDGVGKSGAPGFIAPRQIILALASTLVLLTVLDLVW